MFFRILPELAFDHRCSRLVRDVHDDTNPGEDVTFLGRVGGAHGARAPRGPALFDGRGRGDAVSLDDLLHLDHIVDVRKGRLADRATREAILQDPLHTATLEAENGRAVRDALTRRQFPEFGLRPVHLRDVLCTERVDAKQLLAQDREVVALKAATVWHQALQQVSQRLQPLHLRQGLLSLGPGLGQIGNNDDHSFSIWNPHVPHMAIGLQKLRMVLAQLRDRGAVGPLMEGVLRYALERQLRDHPKRAQTYPSPAE
mmetsp:Transcript_127771/g.285716  ORF Transcript_127771/g.285716 Transcript_127771/m.285716 type:complete len:257 (-) Transcript_127771:143-913(-)